MLALEQTAELELRMREPGYLRFQRWMPVAVFAVSMIVTCTFLAILPDRFRADEGSDYTKLYEPVARSILAGRGFASATGEFSVVYPPGYPLILAGTFAFAHFVGSSEQVCLLALSVLAMALVTVFVFHLAKAMWGIRAAVVSAALWMTFPFALWLTKQPNSELPFMVFFYGALLVFTNALTRKPFLMNFLVCGVLVGLAMLIRPIAIGIPAMLCVIVMFSRIRGTRVKAGIIAMLFAGCLIPVLPWEVLAFRNTGKIIPLSINGPRSIRDGLTYGVLTKNYRQEAMVPADVAALMNTIVNESSDDNTREIAAVVMRQAIANPWVMTKLIALKIARSWYGTDSGRREWPILLLQLVYLPVIVWSLQKLWRAGKTQRTFVFGAALITVYFWGMTILVLSIFRYMLPVMPLLFVLVGAAISKFLASRKELSL